MSWPGAAGWIERSRAALQRSAGIALPLLLVLAGCRGRVEYRRGVELLERGELRDAYLAFHDAWRLNPRTEHEAALVECGRRLAGSLVREGCALEGDLELREALARYALALEYDPRHAPARDGYLRVQEELERGESARSLLAVPDAATDPFAFLGECLEAASLPACRLDERAALVEAGLARLEGAFAALEARTRAEPFGVDPVPVSSLLQDWRSSLERLGSWLDGAPSAGGRGTASGLPALELSLAMEAHDFEPVLRALGARAEREAFRLERELAGIELYREGERFEATGALLEAERAYRRAAHLLASSHVARAAAERAIARWSEETFEAAQASMARGEWAEAVESFEALETRVPAFRDTRDRLRVARQELVREELRKAADCEARELAANALVHYLEARRAAPGDAGIAAEVGRVERLLNRRISPCFELSFQPLDPEDRALRRELWNVAREAVEAAERTLLRSFHSSADVVRDGVPLAVLVEDLDFSLWEKRATSSVEGRRALRSLVAVRNEERERAERELQRLEASWREAEASAGSAPAHLEPMRRDLLELLRGRLEQARVEVSVAPQETLAAVWEERPVPVRHTVLAGELAVRYRADRLGVESRWLSARWEIVDRVEDDGAGGVIDPVELPAREDVLAELAARAGRQLRALLEQASERQKVRYYHLALERLEAGSLELAVENLVAYLFAFRSGEPTLQWEDALRRLELLTRSRAVGEWARGGGPREGRTGP